MIDIAVKYGYSSPTAFTRAFADIHGVTPSEVKDGAKVVAFPPMKFQMVVKGVTPMNYTGILGEGKYGWNGSKISLND